MAKAYQQLPTPLACVLSFLMAGALATLAGAVGSIVAVFLYDRGTSKGDDFAVAVTGLLTVGTFVFVISFAWLSKLHYSITWRTPALALAFCLVLVAMTSVWLWDSHWTVFFVVGWTVALVFGFLALYLAGRFVPREPTWDEELWKRNQ